MLARLGNLADASGFTLSANSIQHTNPNNPLESIKEGLVLANGVHVLSRWMEAAFDMSQQWVKVYDFIFVHSPLPGIMYGTMKNWRYDILQLYVLRAYCNVLFPYVPLPEVDAKSGKVTQRGVHLTPAWMWNQIKLIEQYIGGQYLKGASKDQAFAANKIKKTLFDEKSTFNDMEQFKHNFKIVTKGWQQSVAIMCAKMVSRAKVVSKLDPSRASPRHPMTKRERSLVLTAVKAKEKGLLVKSDAKDILRPTATSASTASTLQT